MARDGQRWLVITGLIIVLPSPYNRVDQETRPLQIDGQVNFAKQAKARTKPVTGGTAGLSVDQL